MNLVNILFLQIKVTSFLKCAPFVVRENEQVKIVSLTRKDRKLYYWYFWRVTVWFFAICMPIRVILRLFSPRSSQNEVASFLLLTMWTTMSLGTNWAQANIVDREKDILQLLNSVIYFQNKIGAVQEGGLTNIVTLFLVIGAALSPILLPLLAWLLPCSPQYLGNVIINCSDPSSLTLLSRVWIYLVELVIITAAALSTGVLSNPIIAMAGMINTFIRHVKY
ncbi:unnamed protein product [Orchesella dallaii]|uniref:Uncharacterized protein n=1 Tax=Orchesella dallaii TaxID=48710 RepID=A0ABP1QHZ9_9HEXA